MTPTHLLFLSVGIITISFYVLLRRKKRTKSANGNESGGDTFWGDSGDNHSFFDGGDGGGDGD